MQKLIFIQYIRVGVLSDLGKIFTVSFLPLAVNHISMFTEINWVRTYSHVV